MVTSIETMLRDQTTKLLFKAKDPAFLSATLISKTKQKHRKTHFQVFTHHTSTTHTCTTANTKLQITTTKKEQVRRYQITHLKNITEIRQLRNKQDRKMHVEHILTRRDTQT